LEERGIGHTKKKEKKKTKINHKENNRANKLQKIASQITNLTFFTEEKNTEIKKESNKHSERNTTEPQIPTITRFGMRRVIRERAPILFQFHPSEEGRRRSPDPGKKAIRNNHEYG